MALGISFSAISRNIPSGRLPSWFIGRPLVAPTLRTPGICLSRSIRFEKNIPCPAFALGSSTHGSETSIVTILSTRNPGFTSSTFIRLRPTEQSRSYYENQCDRNLRHHDYPANGWLPCEPACPRAPSRGPRAGPPESRACGGVNAPRPAAIAVEREEREHKHWNTDRDAFQPRQICRRQRNQSRYATERSQYSKAAAAERKQECFGKELTDQPPSRRTERAANGELTLSHRRLCQQQIRHVRARQPAAKIPPRRAGPAALYGPCR